MTSSKRLRKSAIPSVFPWNEQQSPLATARKHRVDERAMKRKRDEDEAECITLDQDIVVANVVDIVDSNVESSSDVGVQTLPRPTPVDSGTQTVDSLMVEPVKAGTTIREFRNEPVAVQFYTGLENYELFCNVLASLGPSAFEQNYLYGNPTLTVEDQLFITLMKHKFHTD